MAAPDLAKRYSAFVSKLGTDDAGNNPLGAPNAWLTIAAALADLAANYEAATPTAPKYISFEAGTYTTPAFALPPNVFIQADPDGAPGSDGEVIISLTGNITLAAGWSANATAVGGFRGVTIRQTTAQNFDLTLPAPVAGTPSRTLTMSDVRLDCDVVNIEGVASGDVVNITKVTHDGGTADTFTIEAITANVEGLRHNGILTFIDSASRSLVAQVQGLFTPNATAGVVCSSIAATGCTVVLGGCTNRNLTLNETAPGVISVSADAISIPLAANLFFTGTATNADLIRLTDSGGISPIGGNARNYVAVTNNAGNTSVAPDAWGYDVNATIGGAARTSVFILTIPATAQIGWQVNLSLNLPATPAIVIEVRNATAGGTLLQTLTTSDGITEARVTADYNGTEWIKMVPTTQF
jgi:hypothetical protein